MARHLRELNSVKEKEFSLVENILPMLLTLILFGLPFMLMMGNQKEQSFLPHFFAPFIGLGIEFLLGALIVAVKWHFLGDHAIKHELLPKLYKFFYPSLKIIGILWFGGMLVYQKIVLNQTQLLLLGGFTLYIILLFIIKLPLPKRRDDVVRWYNRNLGSIDRD